MNEDDEYYDECESRHGVGNGCGGTRQLGGNSANNLSAVAASTLLLPPNQVRIKVFK